MATLVTAPPPTILAVSLRRRAIPPGRRHRIACPRPLGRPGRLFCLAHQLEEQMGADALENSPWYLLARTILLFKTNKMRPATRALREFANRCEGGAFFLLNPMYQTPYLPCRPERATPGTSRTRRFGKPTALSRTPQTLPPGPTPAKMYRSSPRNLRAATAFSDAIAPTMSFTLGTAS